MWTWWTVTVNANEFSLQQENGEVFGCEESQVKLGADSDPQLGLHFPARWGSSSAESDCWFCGAKPLNSSTFLPPLHYRLCRFMVLHWGGGKKESNVYKTITLCLFTTGCFHQPNRLGEAVLHVRCKYQGEMQTCNWLKQTEEEVSLVDGFLGDLCHPDRGWICMCSLPLSASTCKWHPCICGSAWVTESLLYRAERQAELRMHAQAAEKLPEKTWLQKQLKLCSIQTAKDVLGKTPKQY